MGMDSLGRVRCLIRGDSDDEAFANPLQPDTSTCAGPATAQVIQVDYAVLSITKTTPSLLGGTVTEVTALAPGTLLPTSVTTTGNSKDISGTVQSRTRVTSTSYDSLGRVIERNGPLADATALDKTTVTYHATFNATWPFDFGQVSQVTRYVGTSTSSIPITETYSEYDAFGVPHRIVAPNGQATTFTPGPIPTLSGSDRRLWTISECASGPGCTTPSNSTVTFYGEGTVRSATDPDNVCVTYRYVEGTTYVGAPTRIRRAAATSSCGADITDALANSGEVELRTYSSNEGDRLTSVVRRMDGSQQYVLGGFQYDRDRRLTGAPFENGGSQFSVLYTDVLQTGVVAPGGPSAGAWKTDTTVDAFGRPSALNRFIDASNKITHGLSYASAWSPRPTTLTRGQNGAAISTTTFSYDDFGRLVDATVPEAGTPGAPAPTRFEYDVGDRLIKKRVGSGTAMVRTDLRTYDSLGRLLSVDNDTEHPVNCSSAPSGTPIQDEEYKYDSCPSPDVPTGFTCGNALGRATISRSVLQCGSSSSVVKRGRWFDYDGQGRVKRVAFATVTGSTVSPPAIETYSYTSGGKLASYSSPINSGNVTGYTFNAVGQVSSVTRGATNLLYSILYYPFGPLKFSRTDSLMTAGSTTRELRLDSIAASNYATAGFTWAFRTLFGAPDPDVALMSQTFTRSASGLLQSRTDIGDSWLSRDYLYDSLARLTREQWFVSSPFTTWLKGQFTFGNGQSSTSPADARVTATHRVGDVHYRMQGDGDGYVSQGPETTNYLSGSTQPQSVSRTYGQLGFTHDALGRRTTDYDSNEITASKRNYTYLPNGQLGSVESASSGRSYQMRYDEAGHPITISEFIGTGLFNTYELFWDGDRLVATQISFATARPAAGTPCTVAAGCYTYSTVRWHYHYLGSTLVGATRERVHIDGTVFSNLFWFLTDERGLVHRVVDNQGATWWQAQWDAQGTRTWVGRPQPEMWIPFGLPGQIVLGDYEAELYNTYGFRMPATEATIKPALSATASSVEVPFQSWNATDKSLSTRWSSQFSDPQWIMIDLGAVKPISGVRLSWETAYADGYRIEVANSSSGPWTQVFTTNSGDGGFDEISFSANARYVRLYGTHRATVWGYSLWEFEVFGPWTRPPIALNQWRGYDPMIGGFVSPDQADVVGRLDPEGYAYGRGNTNYYVDENGRESRSGLLGQIDKNIGLSLGLDLKFSCDTEEERSELITAAGQASRRISECTNGVCGDKPSLRRNIVYQMSKVSFYCNRVLLGGVNDGVVIDVDAKGTVLGGGLAASWTKERKSLFAVGGAADLARVLDEVDYIIAGNPQRRCLASIVAHEMLHQVLDLIPYQIPKYPFIFSEASGRSAHDNMTKEQEEDFVWKAIDDCKVCE